MKFKKLITINWGVVQNGEYPLADLTAITGETGVGKSSLGDAIQTIMGAALKNIIVYNAGQDESQNKKRNKEYRTLQGYIAGEDQFRFARPDGCTGIVALTFQSSSNEPERLFTAILNTSVSFEMQKGAKVPRIDELKFFIVKDTEVFMEDFIGEKGKLYSYSKLHGRLAQKYGKNNVIEYRGKEDFLSGLYGHLWGKETTSPLYAKRAAKAFCNFINAKPVDDINSFVRNEFLEPKNMRDQVISLSEALRSLDRARQEAQDVEEGIMLVNRVVNDSTALIEKWHESKREHLAYNLYGLMMQEEKIKEQSKKFIKAESDLKQYEKEISDIDGEITAADENIELLKSKMGKDENFKSYRELQQSLEKAKNEFVKLKGNFLVKRLNDLGQLRNSARDILGREEVIGGIHALFGNLNSILDEISNVSLFQYFTKGDINHEEMYSRLRELGDSFIEYEINLEKLRQNKEFVELKKVLEEENENNAILRKSLSERYENLQTEIRNLENNVVYLPSEKKEHFEILKNALPGVSLKMLYEHVDIKPEHAEWREAIEGFLNANRYAIIADSKHEIDALNVVRDRKLNLKVIQGTKVTEEIGRIGKSVKENSIANLLSFSHPVAEAFILSTYRHVLTFDNPSELKKAGRGIMIDCRAASGNTLFNCRLKDSRYLFGAEGRQKTLKQRKKEFEAVVKKLNIAESKRGILKKSKKLFQQIDDEIKNIATNKTLYSNLSAAFNEYRQTEKQLSLMDIESLEKIKSDIDRYRRGKMVLENRKIAIIKSSGVQEKLLKDKKYIEKDQQKELDKKEEAYTHIKEEYKSICQIYQRMDEESFVQHIDEIKEGLKKKKLDSPASLMETVINEWTTFRQHYTDPKLIDSPKVQVSLNFPYRELSDNTDVFSALVSLRKKFIEEKSSLEHAQAFVHRHKIEEANKKFESTFINDFCNTIHVHIQEGRENINELNSALKMHSFGSDKFAVSTLDPDPELKKYKAYFKAIHELKDAASGDSLLSSIYNEEYRDTTQKLTDLIKDSERRGAELERLADYRNYYNYDIIQTNGGKEISLSRNGKMSGGQGETSYYVIRSINLHAALKAKDMSGNALEAVFMDESFSKTNENRAKEILDYLNKTMGFQVVFAMPTKHIGSFLNLDLDGYHFTKMPLRGKKNGELDYEIWVQQRKLNGEEIKRLYEKEDMRIREEVEKEAEEIFG